MGEDLERWVPNVVIGSIIICISAWRNFIGLPGGKDRFLFISGDSWVNLTHTGAQLIILGGLQLADTDITIPIFWGICGLILVSTLIFPIQTLWGGKAPSTLPETLEPMTIYQDLKNERIWDSEPGRLNIRVLTIFAAQTMLLVMYAISLYNKVKDTVDSSEYTSDQTLYYYGGMVIGSLLAKQVAQNQWSEVGAWNIIRAKPRMDSATVWKVYDCEIRLRFFMSIICNHVFGCFISLTLPILLGGAEDNMDFYLNALATWFIIEIDEIEDVAIPIKADPSKTGSDLSYTNVFDCTSKPQTPASNSQNSQNSSLVPMGTI